MSKNPLSDLVQISERLGSIPEYLDKWANETPDAIACIENQKPINFKSLKSRTDSFLALLKNFGISEGDRICVLAPPSIDSLASFIACCELGAIWVGLNPKYTPNEIEYIIQSSQPKYTFYRRKIGKIDTKQLIEANRTIFDEIGCKVCEFSDAWEFASSLTPLENGAREFKSEVCALVYTSGTTGKPKGARISQKGLIDAALTRLCVWRVSPLIMINNVPINHIGGLGDIAMTCLIGGGCQLFHETFDAKATLKSIEENKITLWYQAPTMFEMCLGDEAAKTTDFSGLKAIVWSGGRASHELIAKFLAIAPLAGVDYSMTESIGAITLSTLNNKFDELIDNVGFPIPHRSIFLNNPNDRAQSNPNQGEVFIRDEFMFLGYDGQKDCEVEINDPFPTGDIVEKLPDGRLRITGREKEMFKSGGYNVYPKEIEQILEAHPNIREACVIPTEDRLFGEVGIAFLSLHEEAKEIDFKAYCAQKLANYKIPKRFIIMAALPMLEIGKVDKNALKSLLSQFA